MSKFESGVMNYVSKNGLSMENDKKDSKVAKYALKLYNKLNGTNFKSKTPKIIILKIDLRQSNKKFTA